MKVKIVFYSIICILSTIICFYCNLSYYYMGFPGLKAFWLDAFNNGASSSITWDLVFITILTFYWMYTEAKKWNVKHLWAYYLVAMGLAIAPPFSLFLVVRERAKANSENQD